MPSRALRWLASGLVVLAVGSVLPGCSQPEQKFENSAVKVPTALDRLREGLTMLTQTGELNSGTPQLKQEIDALEGGDKEALKKQFDELMAQRTPPAVKAKAKTMLGSLPK